MIKLIPKHQNNRGRILSLKQLKDPNFASNMSTQAALKETDNSHNDNIGRTISKTQLLKTDLGYAHAKVDETNEARKNRPDTEENLYHGDTMDYKNGNRKTYTNAKVVLDLNGNPKVEEYPVEAGWARYDNPDPIAQFYVEGIMMSPLFKLMGRTAEYGLARAGNKWARSRIIGREMLDLSSKGFKPISLETPTETSLLHTPTLNAQGRTSLAFSERPKSNISEVERLGVPKVERNAVPKEKIPVSTEFESPDIPTKTLYPHDTGDIQPMDISRLAGIKNKALNLSFIDTMNYLLNTDMEVIPELLTLQYLLAAKNYYAKMGIDLNKFDDTTIAKMLTMNYNQLRSSQSGVLKDKVLWHGSGFEPIESLDVSKAGLYTGNLGLYGNGFYMTNYPNNYGLHFYWNDLLLRNIVYNNSQPFLVNGIKEIGGNPSSTSNSFGLAWYLPEGNLMLPYGPNKTYMRGYFKRESFPNIPEGYHWFRKSPDGQITLAPEQFKGYNVKKGDFIQGTWYEKDPGTGYKVALGNNSWLELSPGRAFQSRQTINSEGPMSPRLIETFKQNGVTYPATEVVVPYDTQVKSLFPHPSTATGTGFTRNWNDPRINYSMLPLSLGTLGILGLSQNNE